jgi:CRP-like cAMP-binding protein
VSGEAQVPRNGPLLDVLRRGECFGEMGYSGRDNVRSADVVAATELTLLEIPVQALASASDLCRLRFRAFLDALAGWLARANVRLAGA